MQLNSLRIKKGWGYELHIANKPEYCGKLLYFQNGKRCSWHYHALKDETFFLESGKIIVHFGEDDDIELSRFVILQPGDSFYVPPLLRHQMIALKESRLFEFSTQHFDTDSYRIIKGD